MAGFSKHARFCCSAFRDAFNSSSFRPRYFTSSSSASSTAAAAAGATPKIPLHVRWDWDRTIWTVALACHGMFAACLQLVGTCLDSLPAVMYFFLEQLLCCIFGVDLKLFWSLDEGCLDDQFLVKIERKRAQTQDRLMNEIAAARNKEEAKRAAAEAKRNKQAAKTEQQAEHIRKTGQISYNKCSCCGWWCL